jgi:hypothetical protein
MLANRKLVKASLLCAITLAALFALTANSARLVASANSRPPAAPEMDRLAKFYAGTWEYTEDYDKSALFPNGGKNTGIYKSETGPGGNSIVNRFQSKGPVGDSEGLLVMTWDPKENAYKAYVFGDQFPGAIVETGHFEGDTLIFRGELSMGAMKISLRNSNRLDPQGKMLSEEFMSTNGAPESRLLLVTAIRKP